MFRAFEGRRGILLAVSGGPDSLALAKLAAAWRDGGGATPLWAGVVDHRLRDGSDAVAEAAAATSRGFGLSARVLRWRHGGVTSRLQERARDARYALLAQEAARVGADAIATAHHRGDQAETVLFRALRGSGIGGLAGMAEVSARDGLALLRPLLGVDGAELRSWLAGQGVAAHDDP
ncbi:MAG: tRNA lysidine(34) synthetase TilS, partial [Hyphomicrobiales bacterium]|nr:tRNA lysidine(34) synthetase TilS [Hyphomicrobiales bacterium]